MTVELQSLVKTFDSDSDVSTKPDALAAVIDYCDVNAENVLGLEFVERALDLINHSDTKYLFNLYTSVGNVYSKTGKYYEAFRWYVEASTIAESKNNDKECSISYFNLGIVYFYLGEYFTAIEHFQRSTTLEEKFDLTNTTILCYTELGEAYRKIGEFDLAIQSLHTILDRLSPLSAKRQIGVCKQKIGSIFLSIKEFDLSKKYYFDALELFQNIDDKESEAHIVSNIGDLFLMMEKYEDAKVYYIKTIELQTSIDGLNRENLACSYFNLAETYIKNGEFNLALENLKIALELAESLGAKHRLFKIHEGFYTVYNLLKNFEKALIHHETFIEYKEQVYSEQYQEKLCTIDELHKIKHLQREREDELVKNVALNAANQKLKIYGEEKDSFIAIAAHELKSPITGILYIANAIKSSMYNQEEFIEVGEMLRISSQSMLDLISHLIESNKLDSGAVEPTLSSVDATQLVRHLTKYYIQIARVKNISILSSMTNPIFVIADMQLLRQVIDNVFSNAIKYSQENTEVQAFIRMNPTRRTTEICIQDNGPGISENDQKKMFKKFQKLTAKPTGGENSTGLGLSICKKLVELMKGTIRCESELGKGSTFIIELPSAEEELFDDNSKN